MEENLIEFTNEELEELQKVRQLSQLQEELSSTDYQAIKYAEGYYTEEEYEPIKEYREGLRKEIRKLLD